MASSKTSPLLPRRMWVAGLGLPMAGTSTTTVFQTLYVANGYISGTQRQELSSFFWRQVVGNSPATSTPSLPYERGWNAINELIRSDHSWSGHERNTLLSNNHDGTFSDVSGISGLDFLDDSRAFALADLNHDGRLEVILKNRTAPQLRILQNAMAEIGDSICFRLRGTKSNRDAIGACNHRAIERAAPNQISPGGHRIPFATLERAFLRPRKILRPNFSNRPLAQRPHANLRKHPRKPSPLYRRRSVQNLRCSFCQRRKPLKNSCARKTSGTIPRNCRNLAARSSSRPGFFSLRIFRRDPNSCFLPRKTPSSQFLVRQPSHRAGSAKIFPACPK